MIKASGNSFTLHLGRDLAIESTQLQPLYILTLLHLLTSSVDEVIDDRLKFATNRSAKIPRSR